MRRAILLSVVLLAAGAPAQWFEGWISLPDSLVGIAQVKCMVHDSATNTVWVGGRYSDRLMAISCDSNVGVASVRTPSKSYAPVMAANPVNATVFGGSWDADTVWVIDCHSRQVVAKVSTLPAYSLFHNPLNNRVYSTNGSGRMTVIDGSTNQVVDSVDVGLATDCFGLDTRRNWLYLARPSPRRVVIVDCNVDTVIASFDTQRLWPAALCYSTRSDLMYCAHYIDNLVLAIRRDTVVAEIPVGRYPGAKPGGLCYNPHNNKVYCANWSSGNVSVINCSTNQVTATIATDGAGIMVYDSILNRLYVGTGRGIAAVDGESNTVLYRTSGVDTRNGFVLSQRSQTLYCSVSDIGPHVKAFDASHGALVATIPTLGPHRPVAVCWDSLTNKVYAACDSWAGTVFSIDGARNAVLARIQVGANPVALCSDRERARVYCADSGSGMVSVIDCTADTLVARIRVGADPHKLEYAGPVSKVYCANANMMSNSVTAIDVRNHQTKTVPVGMRPWALAYSPVSNKVYCANIGSGTVSVISAENDSLIRTITVGADPRALSYASRHNVVYCARGPGVVAIDCSTDSIVATVSIPDEGTRAICYDVCHDLLYCSRNRREMEYTYAGISLVQCRTNTIIADFDVPNSPHWGGVLEFGYNDMNNTMYCRLWDYIGTGGDVSVYCGATLYASFYVDGFGGGFAWNSYNNRMYAACPNRSGIAVFRDIGGAGIEEGVSAPVVRTIGTSSIVRGILSLSEAAGGERSAAGACLLDITGRKVMELRSGPNDIRGVAPGVYFVREEGSRIPGSQGSSVRKIVIQR